MRKKRPYLPGAFFHICARTHGKQPWLTPELRTRTALITTECLKLTDAKLYAMVIMRNHFHLVVEQGAFPLSSLMQPLVRRVALAIQNRHARTGYVFERRFRHRAIASSRYFRRCVAYVHRNPVDAGICDDAGRYPWSTHNQWCGIPDSSRSPMPRVNLLRRAFALETGETEAQFAADYVSFFDALPRKGSASQPTPKRPMGDVLWNDFYRRQRARSEAAATEIRKKREARRDLRDVVAARINVLCPNVSLDDIRTLRGAQIRKLRADLVRTAVRAGHRGRDIARYLGLSESRVSALGASVEERLPSRFGL